MDTSTNRPSAEGAKAEGARRVLGLVTLLAAVIFMGLSTVPVLAEEPKETTTTTVASKETTTTTVASKETTTTTVASKETTTTVAEIPTTTAAESTTTTVADSTTTTTTDAAGRGGDAGYEPESPIIGLIPPISMVREELREAAAPAQVKAQAPTPAVSVLGIQGNRQALPFTGPLGDSQDWALLALGLLVAGSAALAWVGRATSDRL
jgi:hypothetical protein